jgi:hypothetical protein
MLQKESVMSGVPPLVDSWPPPAHDEDDIATVRLPKLDADSLVRSRTLGSPGCPVNVTSFAVPGWKTVGTDADPVISTLGKPALPPSGRV